MNINLSSVSDSQKVTQSTPEGGEAATEASESGGFFAKLTALIKGETGKEVSGEKATSVTSDVDIEVTGEGEVEPEAVKQASGNQSTDSLLEESEAEGSEAKAVGKSDESSPAPDASKIVSDSDQVLQRLDESNKALQLKDGKELPRQPIAFEEDSAKSVSSEQLTDDKPVVSENAQTSKPLSDTELGTGAEQKLTPQEAEALMVNSQQNVGETSTTESDQPVIPLSAQRFIQQSQSESESSASQPITEQAIVAAATIKHNQSENQAIDAQSQKLAAASTQQLSAENEAKTVVAQGEDAIIEDPLSEEAAAVALTATANLATQTDKEAAEAVPAPVTATIGSIKIEGQELADASPDVTSATVSAAIPWGASEQVITDEGKIKLEHQPKSQQAAVAQSVHQALVNQQSQAQMVQQAQQASNTQVTSMSNELAASQLQQLAAATTTPINQDQALLKATLGAKALGTLGKLASGSKEGAQPGSENSSSGFAQQLSQAAGQQGMNSLTQARAEQAAQAPLQLNRELAGEQMAERVQMMMSKNLKNIDIRLDPPELGRMQIRMSINGDGATVHFTVANQQARDVIEQSMPRLREMLAQQGVQLGDSSVQQQASGQQQKRYADSGQGNSAQGGSGRGFQGEENLEPDINLDLNVAAKRDGISYYA
ncbi:flagellar hook-length control protein FliK [Vibrio salilacus]|uniref:flagellar hook-length control protein FliK n=1 Tax=Vibrio salilacus TaxID=1323749 RepID=UPI000C2B498F|nr:flagellar hook-length control protein FliK [Vibrio salilacus]